MPDAKEMSGIPRPVDDLPDGAISVRVIRGELSKNIANQPVELHAGSKVMKANTDENGRAQFSGMTPGENVKATTDVDGEHLESREFPAPAKGGIRLMLVATDPSKPAAAPNAPAISGQVVIGTQSRIVMEPGDEAVGVYYLLDISNNARVPVDPPTFFMFDMPKEAIGTTIMDGSTKLASNVGTRVRVQGPFPPGHTFVQVAAELPASSGDVDIVARFPAALEQLAVVVKKVGDAKLISPQIARQQEFPVEGATYIAGTGASVPAGQEIRIQVTGLPHHSGAPRIIALSLASFIVLAGVWASKRPDDDATMRAAERKRLLAKREKLFADLVRLENDRRTGRVDDRRHASRREELMAALENVYGALDGDDHGPEPAAGAGLAASVGELRAS
jgi:hypothetical protein